MKKNIQFIFVFCLLIAILSFNGGRIYASDHHHGDAVNELVYEETSEIIDLEKYVPKSANESAVYNKLISLRDSFQDGRYYNHYVHNASEMTDNLGTWDETFGNSVTDSPCGSHNSSNTIGMNDCNRFDGGMQCWGFANRIFYGVFGIKASQMSVVYGTDIRVGDWVRVNNNQHSGIVLSVNGDTFTMAEANVGTNASVEITKEYCRIRWGAITYNKSQITYYKRASNYDSIIDDGPSNQLVADGDYYIVSSKDPGFYLDIEGVEGNNNTNVIITYAGGPVENVADFDAWHVTYDSNGRFYKICQKTKPNMCLDVLDASTENGGNVQVYGYGGGNNQRWTIINNTDYGADYRIMPQHVANKSLDIYNTSINNPLNNGANVQIWANDETSVQAWKFIPYTGPADTESPVISNVQFSNVTSAGFQITCNVSDNVGVTSVSFPTWTDAGGQDDIVWHEATVANGKATAYIKTIDHNHESGLYIVHIYAYDAKGNYSAMGTNVTVPSPISNVQISNVTTSGYKVSCSVDPNWGAVRIEFPSWTEPNGQDDIVWHTGTISGGKSSFTVSVNNHNNEKGCYYLTHIYVYDSENRAACVTTSAYNSLKVYVPQSSYTISYNANSGTGAPSSQTKYDHIDLKLSNNVPSREGYTFLGWAESSSATIAAYHPGEKYTKDASATLYAVWSSNHVHSLIYHQPVAVGCTEDGSSAYWVCDSCGKFFSDGEGKTEINENSWIIPATGHSYNEPVYSWTDDLTKVTAVRVCSNNATHVEAEIAEIMHVIKSPTDDISGSITYTAKFTNPAFGEQVKRFTIPSLNALTVLDLPDQLKTIDSEAFSGIASQAIIIPDGCTTIGANAFANCPNLLYMWIPKSVESMAENAIEGSSQVILDFEK